MLSLVAQRGFAANTNGGRPVRPSFSWVSARGKADDKNRSSAPRWAKNRRGAQRNEDLVAQAFLPVWLSFYAQIRRHRNRRRPQWPGHCGVSGASRQEGIGAGTA